jgi:hypothetical protein
VDEGRANDVLPLELAKPVFREVPTSAYRCLSLLSPNKDGDDDFFSSDLPIETLKRSFGAFGRQTPLLILCSGADEHVPSFIDIPTLIEKWTGFVERNGGVVDREHSGVIKGAHHNLDGDDDAVVSDLCQRVGGFLGNISHSL